MDEKAKLIKEIEAIDDNFLKDFGEMITKIREKDYEGAIKAIKSKKESN